MEIRLTVLAVARILDRSVVARVRDDDVPVPKGRQQECHEHGGKKPQIDTHRTERNGTEQNRTEQNRTEQALFSPHVKLAPLPVNHGNQEASSKVTDIKLTSSDQRKRRSFFICTDSQVRNQLHSAVCNDVRVFFY